MLLSVCRGRLVHTLRSFKMSIPVVDFGPYNIDQKKVSDEHLETLSKELYLAFTKVGFVFLKNTGITQDEVTRIMDVSREFFLKTTDLKHPFRRDNFESTNHGWVSLETERLNPQRPGDLKEAFNVTSLQPDIKWPSEEFKDIHTAFFQHCKELSLRVLRVMAHSLDLEPEVFLKTHGNIGTSANGTTLRALYYPPVNSEEAKEESVNGTTLRSLYYPPVNTEEAKEGQLRCGEHSDYGSITLLFQSSEGLQVKNVSGEFVNAPCIPGAVLVNIADLMQRWTSDRFVSVLHRVLLPPPGDHRTRQSMAFFVHPDDEALITCVDGSDKYPPVTAGEYLIERFSNSYGKK